jgi:hypothetical protein
MKVLVISRLGDWSLHKGWLKDRKWDFWGSYFGDTPGRYMEDCDYYEEVKGPKWPPLKNLILERWDKIKEYDWIWLPDDDIELSPEKITEFIEICEKYKILCAQPALDFTGHYAHAPLLAKLHTEIRFTNYIEGMAPLFSREGLERLVHTFDENVSGWGVDAIWHKVLGEPEDKVAIVDKVVMKHPRPIGGGLYVCLRKMHVDWRKEMDDILDKYGIKFGIKSFKEIKLPSYENAFNK